MQAAAYTLAEHIEQVTLVALLDDHLALRDLFLLKRLQQLVSVGCDAANHVTTVRDECMCVAAVCARVGRTRSKGLHQLVRSHYV